MTTPDRNAAPHCSVSSSSSSSLSSHSSSIAAAHSLLSSQGSSISSQSSPLPAPLPRCRGLDLLVKAIHQVNAGSVIGVPYIQRRVTIRRRRRSGKIDFDAFLHESKNVGSNSGKIDFDAFLLHESHQRKRDRVVKNVGSNKKAKNFVGFSSGVEDSVLLPCRRRSDCADELGL